MADRLTFTIQGIRGAHLMRDGALAQLTDEDLRFSLGGDTLTLGQLFKEFGDIQYGYLHSLKTHQHDWSNRNDEAGLASSTAQLKRWFKQLDKEMKHILKALSEDDLQIEIDRTNGLIRTVEQQLEIYIQALMIFFGKLVMYFQAMSKVLPNSIAHYIA